MQKIWYIFRSGICHLSWYQQIPPLFGNPMEIKTEIERGRGVRVQIWPHIILKNNV